MTPSVARVDRVQEVRFGLTLDDPYRWMEDLDDPELGPWLDGQARRCRETHMSQTADKLCLDSFDSRVDS